MNFDDLHHDHARLAEALSEVSATARVIREDGIYDPDRFREVHRFIREVALPHLDHEEEHIFPRAIIAGVPEEVIFFLKRDHEELRVLARRALLSGLDGETPMLRVDASQVVDRFILAFDEHAKREESLFRDLIPTRH